MPTENFVFNLLHPSVKPMVCICTLLQMSKWRIQGFVICECGPEAERAPDSGAWLQARLHQPAWGLVDREGEAGKVVHKA